VLARRVVRLGAQVGHHRVVLERDEAVPESLGEVGGVEPVGVEPDGVPGPEARRTDADVHDDVEQ